MLSGPRRGEFRQYWLTLASFGFYAASGVQNVLVLIGSLALNHMAGRALAPAAGLAPRWRRAVLWGCVAANLGLLLGFKIAAQRTAAPDGFLSSEAILIPLALSFMTFQQIGYVVDCYKGRVGPVAGRDYLFFVLFFPQLVMGPIVQYGQIAGQLHRGALAAFRIENLAVGLSIFTFGLVKKVLLADPLAPPIERVFAAAGTGAAITGPDAWFAAIGFQLQLFLDFSAYADMAIGLGRIFGMNLPINFDAPLRAVDRFDLWRRWHITFVAFMRTHVFLPLVRHVRLPTAAALAATGVLSGLWHGLGWTFVAWGLVQTALLLATHAWSQRRRRRGERGRFGVIMAIATTFLTTCAVGVLFRAPTVAAAGAVYEALIAAPGRGLLLIGQILTPDQGVDWALGLFFVLQEATPLTTNPDALHFLLAAVACWVWPDTARFFRRHWTAIDPRPGSERTGSGTGGPSWATFSLTPGWAVAGGLSLLLAILALGDAKRFVYVQF